MQRRRFALVLSVAALALAAPPVLAQSWPDKPVRILVPAPAGSSLDVLARAIGERLKDKFGQPVVVDNKPAAGGTVATAETVRAPADGSVMLLGFNGPLATGPLIQKAPYDVQKDLAPVIITSALPSRMSSGILGEPFSQTRSIDRLAEKPWWRMSAGMQQQSPAFMLMTARGRPVAPSLTFQVMSSVS